MACGTCRRLVGFPQQQRFVRAALQARQRSLGAPVDLAVNQSYQVDPLNPMGAPSAPLGAFGEAPAGGGDFYVVQPHDDVRLSALAWKLGISAPDALTAAERAAAAPEWVGYLGAAKLIAQANGLSWEGPPGWRTYPVLQEGETIQIPSIGTKKNTGLWAAAIAAGWLLLR